MYKPIEQIGKMFYKLRQFKIPKICKEKTLPEGLIIFGHVTLLMTSHFLCKLVQEDFQDGGQQRRKREHFG